MSLYNKIHSRFQSVNTISSIEFQNRRKNLLKLIPNQFDLCIIPGYGLRYATHNIFYPFHQNTNLLYLCGLNEPDTALVLERDLNSQKNYKMTLYLQPRNKETEVWDGPRIGLEGAIEDYEADQSKTISKLPEYLSQLSSANIMTDLSLGVESKPQNPFELEAINTESSHSISNPSHLLSLPKSIRNFYNQTPSKWFSKQGKIERISPYLDHLRLFKSESEISIMRSSGKIAGRAHAKAMKATRPGMKEHHIYAILGYESMISGATGLSYVPVIAGGRNALIIHYVKNNQVLRDGDLLLVDAGCEYNHYASDITRTWPVNGRFTPAQKQLYNAVLRVQKHIIKKCDERFDLSLDDLQNEAFQLLQDECCKLFNKTITIQEMNQIYPHYIGHYIGMDVHDCPSVSRSIKLKNGMVITVEPGLYIPDSDMYPSEFRGQGVRIEDNIAIGNERTGGPINLTVEAPKEIIDIETLMSNEK